MALRRLTILSILLMIISIPSYSATRLDEEGVPLGYVVNLDCVGAGITCSKSGITGTLTVSGSGGGGAGGVLTSDANSVPYYNTTTTVSEDRPFQWQPIGNTLIISRDIGQSTTLALVVSSETGTRLANISHDGGGYFEYLNISQDLDVVNGGTGLSNGTSGGILGFTGTGTLASSTLLTANAVMVGGGSGATPTTTTADTVAGHAFFSTTGVPAFRSINTNDISGLTQHKVFINFPIQSAKLSQDGACRIDGGFNGSGTTNYIPWRLLFASYDTQTLGNNVAMWQGRMDDNWQGGALTAKIDNIMITSDSTAPAGSKISYGVSIWAITSGDAASLTAESFGTENVTTQIAPSVKSRDETVLVPLTNTDSLAAGDWFMVKLRRTGASQITGDSAVISFAITE